ncbi:MAG TPA: alpha-1,4-glucan--maltose-1-phosphate maltosyltransferase [Falsiroseomonas sp.]|nr:alpha-1,4-glucan--maltose-1-phosphate maltosyltransferase [Falsiroseomonas sp.]
MMLHPLLIGPLSEWDAVFAHVSALGFDTALLAPPFAPGASGSVLRTADHDRPHPLLEAPGDATSMLGRLAEQAGRHGLALHLDLVTDRVAADASVAAGAPQWFAPAGPSGPPDPRRPPREPDALEARWQDPEAAEALADWWEERLRRWAGAGVTGFRCHAPERVPAKVWARWSAALPEARLFAWTPGLPAEAVPRLRGAGFAGVFDSLAWWQPGDGWLVPEHARLASVAPVLSQVEAPFGPRFAAGHADRTLAARAAGRLLHLAAGIGAGLLMPMGFEFGVRRPLDPAQDRPGDWRRMREEAAYDLTEEVREANAALAARPAASGVAELRALSGAEAPVVALLRAAGPDARLARAATLVLANSDLETMASARLDALLPGGGGAFACFVAPGAAAQLGPADIVTLAPGQAMLLQAEATAPVLRAEAAPKARERAAAVVAAAEQPRLAIGAVEPAVDDGRFAVKRVLGEVVEVTADLIMDGHEELGAVLLWRPADSAEWNEVPMQLLGNDRWTARFPLERIGLHHFAVEAWHDVFGSFLHALEKKHAAGQDLTLELEEGRLLVAAAAKRQPEDAALGELARRIGSGDEAARLHLLLDPATAMRMAAADERRHRTRSAEMPVEVDRAGARFASWYELFPRSQAGDGMRHGTFADVIRQLPHIRGMGFDVLYFPPIHPIGRAFRKGRNNTLTPSPTDPGSPYAIGSEAGGHDAIHPELGTIEDFRQLRQAAAAEGLELAIDFAIQCSQDHPWLREHPDWFDWRPDGTIKYAENPPKKYQDIVNVDFYAKGAVPSLWQALRDVVLFWADEGVRLFRVDNPHTKPLPFWEWMIAEVRARYPDAIFLAEAFTRPKMMYRLAKVGFGQSYTYFTWRNEKREIIEYLEELATTAPRDFFRPHFFVNTPDINPVFLQTGGRPAHLIRAALATTLSGLWGMYQGFELCEATPLPGREEYMDSEKYQLRAWPERRPGDIVDEITRLNAIRRANPALQTHLGVAFHNAFNDQVLWYRKATEDRGNVVLCAVSVDPHHLQETSVEVPLWEWGLPDDAALEVEDLMRDGRRFTWHGKMQRIRLDPSDLPFGIWRVRPAGGHG